MVFLCTSLISAPFLGVCQWWCGRWRRRRCCRLRPCRHTAVSDIPSCASSSFPPASSRPSTLLLLHNQHRPRCRFWQESVPVRPSVSLYTAIDWKWCGMVNLKYLHLVLAYCCCCSRRSLSSSSRRFCFFCWLLCGFLWRVSRWCEKKELFHTNTHKSYVWI